MKIVGLITEYNPFHNGHLYHIEKAKEITNADAVIVVMSGNYVQRGTPAIMPKHLRAEVALEAGVPLVLELPVCYATGSAEYFAAGAISLFEKLNCIDAICFGSECGDYQALERIAHVIADEPPIYREVLQQMLKKGHSFPLSRQLALKSYFKDDTLNEILEQPNNILGIEYIKALYLKKSPMEIHTIKRIVSGYHDDTLSENYSSASAIRKLLWHASHAIHLEAEGMYDEPALSDVLIRLEDQVPPACIRLLEENHRLRYPVYTNDFSLALKYKLMTETKSSLAEYMDVTEELSNRIINQLNSFVTIEQFADLIKTRSLTYTRVSRSLFHILLDIRKDDYKLYASCGYTPYARVLGFRKESAQIFKHIKKHSSIPLITKLTQTEGVSEAGLLMLKKDLFASNLYESVLTDKFKVPFTNEHQQSLVML